MWAFFKLRISQKENSIEYNSIIIPLFVIKKRNPVLLIYSIIKKSVVISSVKLCVKVVRHGVCCVLTIEHEINDLNLRILRVRWLHKVSSLVAMFVQLVQARAIEFYYTGCITRVWHSRKRFQYESVNYLRDPFYIILYSITIYDRSHTQVVSRRPRSIIIIIITIESPSLGRSIDCRMDLPFSNASRRMCIIIADTHSIRHDETFAYHLVL